MGYLSRLHTWKQTRRGHVAAGLLEGLLAYLLASKAIDTGSWWQYALAIILIIGTVNNFVEAIKSHGRQ